MISEIDDLLEILQQYPEYLVINMIHHPINWLIKNDQIPHENYKFSQIMDHVDVLLTGHEHVLHKHPIKYINNSNTLHLEAGAFMNVPHNKEPFGTDDNWFSILEINVTKRILKQTRINYDNKNNKWKEVQAISCRLNKKYQAQFSDIRKTELMKSIRNFPDTFMTSYFPEAELEKKDGFYIDKNNFLYILLLADKITLSSDKLIDIIESQKDDIRQIFFVFIDLFNNLALEYSNLNNNRLVTVSKIKHEFDLKFDVFRHNFFSNLSADKAIKYSSLMLICKIIPFWDIEHINFEDV
jgi:hypothetical protein